MTWLFLAVALSLSLFLPFWAFSLRNWRKTQRKYITRTFQRRHSGWKWIVLHKYYSLFIDVFLFHPPTLGIISKRFIFIAVSIFQFVFLTKLPLFPNPVFIFSIHFHSTGTSRLASLAGRQWNSIKSWMLVCSWMRLQLSVLHVVLECFVSENVVTKSQIQLKFALSLPSFDLYLCHFPFFFLCVQFSISLDNKFSSHVKRYFNSTIRSTNELYFPITHRLGINCNARPDDSALVSGYVVMYNVQQNACPYRHRSDTQQTKRANSS